MESPKCKEGGEQIRKLAQVESQGDKVSYVMTPRGRGRTRGTTFWIFLLGCKIHVEYLFVLKFISKSGHLTNYLWGQLFLYNFLKIIESCTLSSKSSKNSQISLFWSFSNYDFQCIFLLSILFLSRISFFPSDIWLFDFISVPIS